VLAVAVDNGRIHQACPPTKAKLQPVLCRASMATADQNAGLPQLSLGEVRAMLEQAKPDEQRRFLLSILERIEIYPSNRLRVVFRHPDLRQHGVG
jgi:hypothetical protein